MIRADGFTFRYPTRDEPSLEGLSFEIEEGGVLGVVGPVEAGKTTLAMSMAGFAPQNTGGVTQGDLSVAGRDPREADDNAVAMVFEDYSSQITQVRVIDEVVAPLVNRGISRSEAVPRARELLDRVRLTDAEEKFTWDLSGGQQQRLAIAAALAIDPDVMVFDTATDMLDPEGREDVANLISSLAGSKTLVVTANDPNDLVGVSDRVLVIDDGEQVEIGAPEDILGDRDLLESVGVNPPLCVEVAHRVGHGSTPLTPQELVGEVEVDIGGRTEPADDPTEDGDDTEHADGEPRDDGRGDRIDVSEVTYEYSDGTVAVDGADLDVYEGEVHAVIGANGAGKSTFSKLLVGLFNPDAGHVRISGKDTDEATAREMATSIGVALQNPKNQLSERTVEDELRFPLESRQYERTGFLSLSKKERYDDGYIEDRVEEVRDSVGIHPGMMGDDPMFLARGRQRLLSIALAVVTDPDAVVLDEPTAGLDANARATVRRNIERMRSRDKSVVLIEHDMDFVCEVADRVTVLSDGEVAKQGTPEEVFHRDNWDWLAEQHMRPPRVARLADELGIEALTVDGLVERLAAEIEGVV